MSLMKDKTAAFRISNQADLHSKSRSLPRPSTILNFNAASKSSISSEIKIARADNKHKELLIPPYHNPPAYKTFRDDDITKEHYTASNAEIRALDKVNVKLLKKQYQEQNQNHIISSPQLTGSKRRNKIKLQLQHWENLGSIQDNINEHKIQHINCEEVKPTSPSPRHKQPHSFLAPNQFSNVEADEEKGQMFEEHYSLETKTRHELKLQDGVERDRHKWPQGKFPRYFMPLQEPSAFTSPDSRFVEELIRDDHDSIEAINYKHQHNHQMTSDILETFPTKEKVIEISNKHDIDIFSSSSRDISCSSTCLKIENYNATSYSKCITTTKDLNMGGGNATYLTETSKCNNISPNLTTRRSVQNSPIPLRQQQHVQMKLLQNPLTRQLIGVVQDKGFQPKTSLCRNDCELSGSYASLECPSPPRPPGELHRDPQARLINYLKSFYQELCYREPGLPTWALPLPPGIICAARLEPDLRLSSNSHGCSDLITVDQILVSIQTKDGSYLEAPRRCLIECPTWVSRSSLCLRILHSWAKEPPWPSKGTPVALTLFIPLQELKRGFAFYVEKELLPKGPLNPFKTGAGFTAAWNTLEALGPKLLIILDGYNNQKYGVANSLQTPNKLKSGGIMGGIKRHYPADVYDLLDGKLFPEARIIIATNTTNCLDLIPLIHRHLVYDGLSWGRSVSILKRGQWTGPSRLLDTVQHNEHLRKSIRTLYGCLAISTIYETSNGDLPLEELDVVEAIVTCVAPEATTAVISELGRLALFCLKMRRTHITLAEIKMYCSEPETVMGCLDKSILFGKTAIKKADYVFNPICPKIMEYLAANYITSLATRPGLLAAEISGLTIGDELEPELLNVLKFSMALLGDQAFVLLSRLTPLWLSPQAIFTLALAGGHNESNLSALCDILGISKHPPISPLETKPLWVQVRSVPTDLMGWGMALKSPTCTLKNLEVIYQLEKQNLGLSRKAMDMLLNSVMLNESVSNLRLSSLIEMDVKDSEISYLANCISKLILKPKLESFELILTLIEEDPPILKLQSVVNALYKSIPCQKKLSSLSLDLGLSASQLVQLCSALEKCRNITRLSLPHLKCERSVITALSSLIKTSQISFLSLPSCWGARDDPPSSSGVSMGSGSGSSTGTSCLIKQGSLPGVPSPKSYAPGAFSSLPRGAFVAQTSLGRSATLPRQTLEQTAEKRSCDSVVSKMWYPTPACDGGPHNSGTLHELFLAIRDSYSKVHSLDLSKAQLSLEDSMCLGETVRLSNTLHTLKLEGSSRISEILPSILGVSESQCLQMLSLGSQRLTLEDSVMSLCIRALTNCSTLRLLTLDGWGFRIEHAQTLSILQAFLSLTSIRELSLSNCRLQTGLITAGTKPTQMYECRSVVVLKLAGVQLLLSDQTVLRGPQLLRYIGGFPCLRELDLSAPARSSIESTHSSPLILDDKCMIQFFNNLHSYYGLLNTLKICNWVIHFDEMPKTLKLIGKAMRNSPLSHIKLDGISILDRPRKQRNEAKFIHCFISFLPHLRWMGISLSGKKEEQVTAIANAVFDLKGSEIEIKLSESTIDQAKLMAQTISVDGKFDVKVSTFGTSSGILIHVERSGLKSLQRKNKEREQYT